MTAALVTGASGFIGTALCRRLAERGMQVRALMRKPSDGPWDRAVCVNLGQEPVPQDLLAGVDSVFHLAGKAHALADSPRAEEEYRLSNLQGTLDLLAAARAHGVRAFVYFSSVKAMGEGGEDLLDEEAEPAPRTPYGRTKLAAERAVLGGGDVPHPVVLRPTLVYGPNPKGYLNLLIRGVRRGWFPPPPEVGKGRSMIHRDDLAEAALLVAADPRAAGRTYILTDGTPYSTCQIYRAIRTALGRPIPRWGTPIALLRVAAIAGDALGRIRGRRFIFNSEVLEKLVGSARYSGERICREIGFSPRHHLRDSMKDILASMDGR